MSRELADITIKLKSIEDTNYDAVIEFLEDNNIDYDVEVENLRTEYDDDVDGEAWLLADIRHDEEMIGELE